MEKAPADPPTLSEDLNPRFRVETIDPGDIPASLCSLVATTILPRRLVLGAGEERVEIFAGHGRLLGLAGPAPVAARPDRTQEHHLALSRLLAPLREATAPIDVFALRLPPEIAAGLDGTGIGLDPESLDLDAPPPATAAATEPPPSEDPGGKAGNVVQLPQGVYANPRALNVEEFLKAASRYFTRVLVQDRNGALVLEQGVSALDTGPDDYAPLQAELQVWEAATSGILSRAPKIVTAISDDGAAAFVCALFPQQVVFGETEKSRIGRILGAWSSMQAGDPQ